MKKIKMNLTIVIAMIGLVIGCQAVKAFGDVVYVPTGTIVLDGQSIVNGEWVEE